MNETKHGTAERMRRLRERKRRGTRVFKIELDEAEIEDLLIGTKHLRPENADSHRAVESALQSLIDRLAVSYLSRE
jgi:cytidylate kinase